MTLDPLAVNPFQNNGKLYMTIGMARSGKSTFSKKWTEYQISKQQPSVVISGDDIRLAISGQRYNIHVEPLVHVTSDIMIKTHLIAGYHVLVDSTHVSDRMAKKMLRIDNSLQYYLIDTPVEVCIERANKTFPDLVPVIEKMHVDLSGLLEQGYSCDNQNVDDIESWNHSINSIEELRI